MSVRHRVVVVGGGLAGCAAAVVLAERRFEVELVEREAFLGGRAGAWTEALPDGTPYEMERGFHAFFRHYENVRALLRRVDPALSMLRPLPDYPLLGPGGATESFAGLPSRAPLNVLALLRRSPSIKFRDLVRVDLARARELLAFHPEQTYAALDSTSARAFLDGLRFPPKARQMLFDVFAHSFFNPEERYSAAELLAMFHFYFTGNPRGLVFDVMKEPFSVALWEPMGALLRRLGVRTHLETSVASVVRSPDGAFEVRVDGARPGVLVGDAIVLATDVSGLKSIVAASPDLAPLRLGVDSLAVTSPFAVLRLWMDRPCAPSRAAFAGTTGVGVLDNISLYDRFEGESARWAARHRGGVVELHAYALDPDADRDGIRAQLLADLHAFYPETRAARVLHERWLWRQDCPAFAPGSHALRPTVETALPGVLLAGDFVKLPFPSALMERAVTSGFLAANAVCAATGVRGAPVAVGPTRGLLALA